MCGRLKSRRNDRRSFSGSSILAQSCYNSALPYPASVCPTHFAHILKYSHDHFEEANMERRQRQPNVTEVAVAVLESSSTGIAETGLPGYTHTLVEWTMLLCNSFSTSTRKVV